MRKVALLSAVCALGVVAVPALGQKKAPAKQAAKPAAAKPAAATGKPVKMKDGFTKLPSGLQYRIVKHGTGTTTPMVGDHLEMHVHVHIKDSVMFDTRKMNGNKPAPVQLQAPSFKGDVVEGFTLLHVGDSAQFRLPVDSIKAAGRPMMPGMKEGDVLAYEVVLVSLMNDKEYKADAEKKTLEQKKKDDDALQGYFKEHNIKPIKTNSGLYYTIEQEGTGPYPHTGSQMSMNYTGKLLGGKTFDSNTDPEFHHTEPLKVELGKGRVIKGWDEGLALLKKGSKATLYIPSGLAYGSQDRSPQIPANSILVFNVEVMDITNQAEVDDALLQKYFEKNNLHPKKTASGLYYTITQEGSGEKPAMGSKVSVNYTGMTLDGKKFDSNIDTAFHHVQPFNFPLGQGHVIKGWDEGIALLNKGGKATLYIPSGLAYGAQSPSPLIPANGILIFDVELTDIQK